MGAWPAAASVAGAAGSEAGGSIARVSAEVSAAALAASRQPRVSASTCTVTWKRSPGLPGSSPPANALSATSPNASARRCALLAASPPRPAAPAPAPPPGAQHHCAHLGGQPCPQHHHAVIVHPRAQRAPRQAHLLRIRLRLPVRLPPRPHQPLHLRAGGAAGDGDQARLIVGAGHPRKGAYDGVGKPAAGHGRGEVVELGQRGGDAQLFAGGAEIEAGAPVEPVGTGTEALPAMLAVELAEVTKQLVGGGLDACRQLGDAVPSRSRSGGASGLGGAALALSAAVGSLAPGATGMAVTVAAGCSVVDNSGHAAGVAWRSRGDGVGCHASMVHPVFDAPLLARGRAVHRSGFSKGRTPRGRPRARAEGGNEGGIGRVGDVEESGAQYHVNPFRPATEFSTFFWTFGVSRPPAGSPRTSSASSSSAPTENPALIARSPMGWHESHAAGSDPPAGNNWSLVYIVAGLTAGALKG